MKDEAFLQLPPTEARRFANFAGQPEEGRLKALYHERNGVDLEEGAPSRAAAAPSTAESGGLLVGLAWLLIVGGALMAVSAFFFDVGVGSGSGGLYGIPERVANVDKIAVRDMLLATGLACFISGWVLAGAEHVASAIRQSGARQA